MRGLTHFFCYDGPMHRSLTFGLGALAALFFGCQGADEMDDAGLALEPGDEVWQRSLPAAASTIAVGYDLSVAVTGSKGDELWVGRFSRDGDEVWSYTEPGYQGRSVVIDAYATYVAAGSNSEASVGRVMAFDRDGQVLWTLDDAELSPRALAPAPGGGVYAVGPVGDASSIFMERVLPSGDVQWLVEEDGVAGSWLDADATSDGVLFVTGLRDDGSWWMHARSSLADRLWTTELGQPDGGAFPSLSVNAQRLDASVLTQGDGSRGSIVELDPWGGVRWVQELDVPPTDIASNGSDYSPLLVSYLAHRSVDAIDNAGVIEWSVAQDPECPKSYAVVRRSVEDALVLRWCGGNESQLVLFKTS